jgi:hypothetical protein
MLSAYHIQGLTPPQVEEKIVKFMLTHILSLHKQAVQANNDFQSGNYKAVGTEGGVIVQQIFGNGRAQKNLKEARDTLQQLNNGFFEQAGLPDPTTVVSCYDDDSAELTVDFIGTVLQLMADNNVVGIEKTIKAFEAQAPQQVKDCLKNNAEIQLVQQTYGFAGLSLDQIQAKVEVYAFAHLLAFKKAATQANNDFKAGNFVTVGKEGGQMAQAIFKNSKGLRSDRDTLQQVFNGFWEQAGLSDPQTAVACFDDSSASQAVKALGSALSQLATNNVVGAEKTLTDFANSLPQSVKSCLGSNNEVQSMLSAYHIQGLTPAQAESKIVKFMLTHILALHKDAVQANNDFQSGNYKAVGTEGGVIAQQIFGNGQRRQLRGDRDTLQQVFNGFWEQAGLSDPQTAVACFDDNSATQAVNALGNALSQLASNNVVGAEKTLTDFGNNLPDSAKTCLSSNSEVQSMLSAYHIQGLTPPQVEEKIVKYMLTHILSLHKQAVQANNDFQSGNYKAVGTEGGVIVQQIFGSGMTLKDDADTLQQLYNGLFNQVGLLNPVTVVSCYDTNSISLTVDTIGTLLQEVAGASFIQAAATLKNYYSQLPANVVTCLQNNGEFIQVIRKYNLSALTRTQILAKFTQFSVLHAQELVSLDTVAANQFNKGAFAPAGQQIGVITQRVIGTSSATLRDDPQNTLQQYLNGYFEFIGLDDPTTVVSSCFNDDTATLVNTLIANLVDELANNKILIAEKSALDFIKNCPPSLKACVFNNPEVVAALKAYRLSSYTPPVVVAKAVAYALTHVAEFTSVMVEADQAIQTQEYASAGKIFGQVTQAIFPPTFPQRYFRTAF